MKVKDLLKVTEGIDKIFVDSKYKEYYNLTTIKNYDVILITPYTGKMFKPIENMEVYVEGLRVWIEDGGVK